MAYQGAKCIGKLYHVASNSVRRDMDRISFRANNK